MSRRSTTKTTVVTSTVKPSSEVTIDFALLRDDDFEKRPKTDYTYSRSATYSSKYVDGKVISPNLSRRRLYTEDMLRDQNASSSLMKQKRASTGTTTTSSHVRVYGGRNTRNSLAANNNQSSYNSTILSSHNNANNNAAVNASEAAMNGSYIAANSSSTRNTVGSVNNMQQTQVRENVVQHTVYTTRNSNQAYNNSETNSAIIQHQNNNNSEAIFSEDEANSSIMSRRSTSKRKTTRRASSRSRSPGRNVRGAGSTRKRSSKYNQDDESEYSIESMTGGGAAGRKSASYALSTGLDSDTEENSLVRLTNKNTRLNAERQAKLDAEDLVTERSSTIIDTVATGTPITAKIMGCILFIYGCTCIFINRVWYSFGHPVYATLQRYLLLDTLILSRAASRRCRALLLGLLFLLLPILLLLGATCSLHAMGFVNVQSCGPLTGVYYVSKQSDLNAPGIGANIRKTLTDLFTWSNTQQAHKPPIPVTPEKDQVDWQSVIDARIANLKVTLDQDANKMVSEQRQKNTELEAAVHTLTSDLDKVSTQLSSISTILSDLDALKRKVAQLQIDLGKIPDNSEAIAQLQRDIRRLQTKLGEVNLGDQQQQHGEAGVLMYIINEINNLASVTKYILGVTDEQPKLKSSVAAAQQTTPTPLPVPCPESSCVCESDLALRLKTLHEKIMAELDSKGVVGGTTLFVSSENSTGISEQLVKKMIQDELDIFAEDHTGMPDFALQSMGAQVVSTRCSQTYHQETGIMTFLGLPLYHLHKEPSVVIQPGVVPGECWCFHGQAGTLVVEMADNVKINSFSIEHISAKQSVTGEINSAPKEIEIYGLSSELDTNGQRIGGWLYNKNGPRLQFFPVKDMSLPAFPLVELRVLSNWGKEEFTCLYRFRVHGKLAPK